MTCTNRFAPLAAALAKVCQTVDGWDVPPENAEMTYWESYWARHARGANIETVDDQEGALWALALLVGHSPAATLRDDMRAQLATVTDADISGWVEAKLALAHRATHSGGPRGRAAKMMKNACERRPGPLTEMQRTMRGIHPAQIDRWMGY